VTAYRDIPLEVKLDGRLERLDGKGQRTGRILPMAPAALQRDGTVRFCAPCPETAVADCVWRETTMEAHERQRSA
jgi:hypothetical protein